MKPSEAFQIYFKELHDVSYEPSDYQDDELYKWMDKECVLESEIIQRQMIAKDEYIKRPNFEAIMLSIIEWAVKTHKNNEMNVHGELKTILKTFGIKEKK